MIRGERGPMILEQGHARDIRITFSPCFRLSMRGSSGGARFGAESACELEIHHFLFRALAAT